MPEPRFRKTGRAVALRWWTGLPAPFLAAKASGRAAARLEAIAAGAGVPIVRDPDLAATLYPLDIGAFVPEICFEVVARVLAFARASEET